MELSFPGAVLGIVKRIFHKKPVIVFLVLALGAFVPGAAGANPPGVTAAVNSLARLGSFRATLTLEYPSGHTIRGVLSYQRGRFNLRLSDGRVVASNGNQLIVYSPETGVVGKQDLTSGGGAGWLLSGFQYTETGNSATGVPVGGSRISKVRVTWDQDRQFRSVAIQRSGSEKWMKISLSGVRKVDSFPASIFSYKPPAGSRTVENPLNMSN